MIELLQGAVIRCEFQRFAGRFVCLDSKVGIAVKERRRSAMNLVWNCFVWFGLGLGLRFGLSGFVSSGDLKLFVPRILLCCFFVNNVRIYFKFSDGNRDL